MARVAGTGSPGSAPCAICGMCCKRGRMPYAIRFSLFLLAALTVVGVLGCRSGYFGSWAVLLVILVIIPLTIEIGRKVLKRDPL